MREIDIAGRRFGRLTALRRDGIGDCWQSKWLCRCDCGREVSVFKNNLMRGRTRSCGCLRSDILIERNRRRDDKTAVG